MSMIKEPIQRIIWYLKSSVTRELPEDTMKESSEYPKFWSMLKYFFPLFKKHWKIAVFCGVLTSISMLIAIPAPMVSRYLIDNVILKKNLQLLIPVLIVLGLLKVMPMIFGNLLRFLNIRFERGLTLGLNEMIFSKLTALPKSFFDKNQSGYLMARTSANVSVIKWFLGDVYSSYFNLIVSVVAAISFLFYLEWKLALIIVVFTPLSFVGSKFILKKNYVLSHYTSEINSRTTAAKYEIYDSMPLVKAFSTEKRTITKLLDLIRLQFRVSNEMMAFGVIERFISSVVPQTLRYLVFLLGAYWIIKGKWELGSLYAFQSYMNQIISFPGKVTSSIKNFQNNKVSLERLSVIFEAIPEDNVDTGLKVQKLEGNVEFRDISFYYEKDKSVLKNISFQTRKGEHWAVIGRSGIGKSTLISIIMRFYKPQSGTVLYDGKPATDYNIRALRRRVGYVGQNVELLSGTIAENIKYGNHDATENEIKNAAEAAKIRSFIEELPDKYETVLGEHGVNLSEGQKQRISIARALVRKPDILIFDEPTSSLDNITESEIYRAIPEYIQNRTTFTIAHRLNTIKNADKILLLVDDWKYFIGTHEDLIKNNKHYQNFFNNKAGNFTQMSNTRTDPH